VRWKACFFLFALCENPVDSSPLHTGMPPYRVAGNVRVSLALGGLTVPYDRSGRFSL
jgi:hypothetical protein